MSKHSFFHHPPQINCLFEISVTPFVHCRSISSTTEAWELSSLAHKVTSIYEHLTNQLVLCYQYIGGYNYTFELMCCLRVSVSIYKDKILSRIKHI